MYDSQDREERIEHSGKTLDVSLDPLHILDTLRKHGYRFKNKDRLLQYKTLMFGGYECMYNGYPCKEIHFTENGKLKVAYRHTGYNRIIETTLNLDSDQTSISIYTDPTFIHNVIQIGHCDTMCILTGNDLYSLLDNIEHGEFPVVLNLGGDYQLATRLKTEKNGEISRSYCYYYMHWDTKETIEFNIVLQREESTRNWAIMNQAYSYHFIVTDFPFILVSAKLNFFKPTTMKKDRTIQTRLTTNKTKLENTSNNITDNKPQKKAAEDTYKSSILLNPDLDPNRHLILQNVNQPETNRGG